MDGNTYHFIYIPLTGRRFYCSPIRERLKELVHDKLFQENFIGIVRKLTQI